MTRPEIIKIFDNNEKLRNKSKEVSIVMPPTIKILSVYMIKFIRSITVAAAPGMPSSIIKNAVAGWPPEADGVIAEKYTSAAP